MSRQSIQVAEQGTLEAVLSAVQGIQTQMSAGSSSEHLVWLTDYKLFGEESYVFNDKNKLHELYLDYDLVMNDNRINVEAFNWIVTAAESGQAHVGQALAAIHGMTETGTLGSLGTMGAVVNNNIGLASMINKEWIMDLLINDTIKPNYNYESFQIISTNNTYYNKFKNSKTFIGKYAVYLAGLNSNNYIDMDHVASNVTALNAIALNNTARYFITSTPLALSCMANSSLRKTSYCSSDNTYNYPTTIESGKPCFVINVSSNATKYQFYLKYAYENDNIDATSKWSDFNSSSIIDVNAFTPDGIVCAASYSGYGVSADIHYIPCG